MLDTDGSSHGVTVPNEPWADSWRASPHLVPANAAGGYLLVGATALAIVSDAGILASQPLPSGYVALAPTSVVDVVLLASRADADESGGLTESAPFSVYLWRVGDTAKPVRVRDRAVAVTASSIGLAWLRGNDGAWWLLPANGQARLARAASPFTSLISPDGRSIVSLTYSSSGCDQSSSDPCSVSITDPGGAVREFVGPSLGASFEGSNLLVTLSERPPLGLAWRALVGTAETPAIIDLN